MHKQDQIQATPEWEAYRRKRQRADVAYTLATSVLYVFVGFSVVVMVGTITQLL